MTDGEKLRERICRAMMTQDMKGVIDAIGLSLETLSWCRANRELIEALRDGTRQAVPVKLIKAYLK